MRSLRVFGLLFAAAAFLFSTAPVSAQSSEGGPLGKWWKRPRFVEVLHITPEQQERLDQIFAKNRRSFIDLKADIERRQVDLEELMAKKDSDPKRVTAAVDALEQARMRLRKSYAMMVLDMREILTAEQWQTFLERTEEAKRDREERRGLGRRGFFRDRGARDGAARDKDKSDSTKPEGAKPESPKEEP